MFRIIYNVLDLIPSSLSLCNTDFEYFAWGPCRLFIRTITWNFYKFINGILDLLILLEMDILKR